MKINYLHVLLSKKKTKLSFLTPFSRWAGAFVVFSFFCWGATTARAATKAQLTQQVKKMETFYKLKAWKEVATSALFLTKKKNLKSFPQLYARVYLCLGGVFFHQKQKSFAAKAYERAYRAFPKQTVPLGSTDAMKAFFTKVKDRIKKEQAFFKTAVGQSLVSQTPAANEHSRSTNRNTKGSVHIGWLIGLPVAVAGIGSLIGALGAGLNAYYDHTKSVELFRSAQKKAIIDPLVRPTVLAMRENAKTYEATANILYIVGGSLSLVAAGLITWAVVSTPPSSPKVAALPSGASAHQLSRKVMTRVSSPLFLFKAE